MTLLQALGGDIGGGDLIAGRRADLVLVPTADPGVPLDIDAPPALAATADESEQIWRRGYKGR